MISWPAPAPLFNPITSVTPLTPAEVLAGPYGLIVFLPLIPLILLLARRWPRAALLVGGLAWLLPTMQPMATGVLCGWLVVATGWLLLLHALRRRGRLGRRAMIGLVWIGLHALVFPLWWQGPQAWYHSPMAPLHAAGFAYFLLRYIAWGVALAEQPGEPLRALDTLCWLLYPPCMRLGPVLRRETFLARLDAWQPWRSAPWRAGARRFGWFVLGVAALLVAHHQIRIIPPGGADFFAAPQEYATHRLVRVFYVVPIFVYLLLWTYNELACALALWVGLRVDDNFRYLPLATSVRDFWRRWHITVGAWFRDYLYIPLGGNRGVVWLNFILVFGYCGLWHGASWSFVAWGLSQALGLIVQRFWDRLRARLGRYAPRGPLWIAACWLLTIHYQIATIVVFTDFNYLGWRLFRELWQRLIA